MNIQLIQCLALAVTLASVLCSEYFTAITGMENVLQTEGVIIEKLSRYIRYQEERLTRLRRISTNLFRGHNKATKDPEGYLSNPVNAFLLIKRLTIDWGEIEQLVTYDMQQQFMGDGTNYKQELSLPSEHDLAGASQALALLQDVYKLNMTAVSDGLFSGSPMSAEDCFELGKQLSSNGDQYSAILWLREALHLYELGRVGVADKALILEHLAFNTYLVGNVRIALEYIEELLEIQPYHMQALRHKVFYEELVQNDEYREFNVEENNNHNSNNMQNMYQQLCRGDIQRNANETFLLKCRYETSTSAFSKLAPFKLEEVHDQPQIVIYHDVISDNEIHVIKKLAQPRLERASVLNHETGNPEHSQNRISKSAWLRDHDDPVVRTISQRVEDMTGLTMDTAESLNVINYGLGGRYDPHFDFFQTEKLAEAETGNRIATVLFYISDVAHGGGTVFPKLGVSLKPQKGSAAVWYNLHSSGDLDFSTGHGACPVLIGNKWVANKWIRERGQEFRRKCDLQRMVNDGDSHVRRYIV